MAKRIAPWDSWRRAGQRKQGETWGQEMAKRKGPTWDSWIRGQRANENGRHGVLGGKRAATETPLLTAFGRCRFTDQRQ